MIPDAVVPMRVQSLHRYPVKSMLGETLNDMFVDERGAEGDRRLALIDTVTRRGGGAEQAPLWRFLLHCSAYRNTRRGRLPLPDRSSGAAGLPVVERQLSRLPARPVRLVH